ncbi:unnamed protein product, partial [Prorocentrum cordatum]
DIESSQGEVDEVAAARSLVELFQSKAVANMLGMKGHTDMESTMNELQQSIDENGQLKGPQRWVVTPSMKQQAEAAAEDGDEVTQAEYDFWKDVEKNNFAVPTDGKVSPMASRWQRAYEGDASLKKRYDSISGVKINKRKAEFRRSWALDKFKKLKVTKSYTAIDKKQEFQHA